jgi:hypothetical protein
MNHYLVTSTGLDSDRIDEPLTEAVAKVGRMAGNLATDLAKWGAAREKVECL